MVKSLDLGMVTEVPLRDGLAERISMNRLQDPFLAAKDSLDEKGQKNKFQRKRIFGNDKSLASKEALPKL